MRLLTIFCLLLSFGLMAKDYKSLQRLNEGDVISAEVFNDILDSLELTLRPIDLSELVGKWSATQYSCSGGSVRNGASTCNGHSLSSITSEYDLFIHRTTNLVITDNQNGTVTWKSEGFELLVNDPNEPHYNLNTEYTHICSIAIGELFACKMDDSIKMGNNQNLLNSFASIKRTSPTQLLISWGPERGAGNLNFIKLNKQEIPPEPPSNLKAANSEGIISLSWDEVVTETIQLVGGTQPVTQKILGAASYRVQSKDSPSGDWTEIGSPASNSFSDNIQLGTSKWYRVFAVNEFGSSKGSNVVSITYSE